ncbi:MAG: CDP-alcohol phosphatidyltransferase family protein [Thermoanaerobaculia bacterium]|nr:CDP-alcohol phosphatidyltransferase family protein [Thermoanaerobaculia bacterium]
MHPWRARLERWFTPAARHSPLTPNQITLTALSLNLVAAIVLGLARHRPDLFLAAPAILAIAGLLDAFDGIVARVRGLANPYGDFLDHLCDRISDTTLLAGFLYGTSVRPSLGYAALIAVIMTGYAGTQIEATFRKRSYEGLGRGEFVLGLFILPIVAWILARLDLLTRRFGALTIPEWLIGIVTLLAIYTVISRARRARSYEESGG